MSILMEEADADKAGLRERIAELEGQVEDLESDSKIMVANNKELCEEVKSLKEELEETKSELGRAEEKSFGDYDSLAALVEALLSEVERATGSLQASLPITDHSSRALIALYDAINRNL